MHFTGLCGHCRRHVVLWGLRQLVWAERDLPVLPARLFPATSAAAVAAAAVAVAVAAAAGAAFFTWWLPHRYLRG